MGLHSPKDDNIYVCIVYSTYILGLALYNVCCSTVGSLAMQNYILRDYLREKDKSLSQRP